jgi:hemerythrin-like domain-containing protein
LLFIRLQASDELRIKAEDQHAAIRKMIAAFRSSEEPEESALMSFAALLEEHIRFEERILFPYLEKLIPREELDEIGRQLEQDHVNKVCLTWTDEFWIKK